MRKIQETGKKIQTNPEVIDDRISRKRHSNSYNYIPYI